MNRLFVFSFIVALGQGGCTKEEPPAALADADAGAEAVVPAAAPEMAYITSTSGLRRKPTTDRKVELEAGKKVNNWQMTLYRGEEVTVLKVENGWAHARASDDTEGWVQKKYLLPTEGVQAATIFEEVKTFGRPDLLALGSRKLQAGDLLFVVKSKDQFSEVNRFEQYTTWVLSEKVNTEKAEISAAKLLAKGRLLQKKGDAEAEQIFELARSQFGGTRLVTMMDEEAAAKEAAAKEEAAKEGAEPEAPDAGAEEG